ncbi:MBL fold metallo-hydrolase [Cronobacter dublinensis]|uniref:MBL fold metallo-hydrolase n=1 Tax=Cronobacter dublinensis TaxID=413497 RepID=UPI00300E1D0D
MGMVWKNPWYDPTKAHHRPDGFCNTHDVGHQPGDLRRWQDERKAQGLPRPPADGYEAFIRQWWQPAVIEGEVDGVWWLGHATLLIRLNGRYLLTDPLFSRRASPVSFYGPARKTPLPLELAGLPRLDAVLISHNHYDHLDNSTIRRLAKRFPDAAYFVPLGLKGWFTKRGITNVTELDWWESKAWEGLQITAVPAQHWSMRTPWDRNRSLWCGWVTESASQRFWFSGDSGYTPELLEIPRRLGPLTGAAIPIGAYAPRWFMAPHHMDPQHAVELWQHVGRPLAIPIHWGVFELADESLDTPPQELLSALAERNEKAETFAPRRIGQYLSLSANKR